MNSDYLQLHNLQQRIQTLIQDVLREQPDDPYMYMVSQLRSGKESLRGEEKPKNKEGPKSVVPAPPMSPPPGNQSGPRKGRHFAPTDKEKDAKFEPPMPQEEAKTMESVRKEESTRLATDILSRAREKTIESATMKEQVRSSLRAAYAGSAVTLSPEYHKALTRWTLNAALLGACNAIGNDEVKSKECFSAGASLGRVSMPTPVVDLGQASGGGSWGEWLAENENKMTPSKIFIAASLTGKSTIPAN